jgi:hypothetical protein
MISGKGKDLFSSDNFRQYSHNSEFAVSILLLVVMQYCQKNFLTFAAPPALHANHEKFWSDGQCTLNGFQFGNQTFPPSLSGTVAFIID